MAVRLRFAKSMTDVAPAQWDACAGDANPFVSHAFLSTLEGSGSATAKTGWLGQHALLETADGQLIGCAPLYLKSHSYGEYVFDRGWAEAYERAGGRYYPKLQLSVPFTPVTGPRLMMRPGAPADATAALVEGLVEHARRLGVSSLHATFPGGAEMPAMTAAGFLPRIGQQFHWINPGYTAFDDFLGALQSRKRKDIRKERAAIAGSGITLQTLVGGDIRPHHWDAFHRFYCTTIDRKWGPAYLTRSFFELLSDRLGDRVVLVFAEADGIPVAGALNLRGRDALYGRNWGSLDRFRFLHFEACYYRAIDFAITNRIPIVEAGSERTHKIQRGYLPVITYSAHWIADPRLRDPVADFLKAETREVMADMQYLAAHSPYRQATGGNENAEPV
ncbi:MAG: GNAT family N-acetyltransferase [Proteobacteria bacterium]|nr:GNAT family N-acetyltransferase [Pseudomonadota bacterium]